MQSRSRRPPNIEGNLQYRNNTNAQANNITNTELKQNKHDCE